MKKQAPKTQQQTPGSARQRKISEVQGTVAALAKGISDLDTSMKATREQRNAKLSTLTELFNPSKIAEPFDPQKEAETSSASLAGNNSKFAQLLENAREIAQILKERRESRTAAAAAAAAAAADTDATSSESKEDQDQAGVPCK